MSDDDTPMSNDEDLLADVTVDAAVEQRRAAAADPAPPWKSAVRGGEMSDDLMAVLGGPGGGAPPVPSPSVRFPANLTDINQMGAAATLQPSEVTPAAGATAVSTARLTQQSAAAAALLSSLHTPRQIHSPPAPTQSNGGGIDAAILRRRRSPYDAVASQQKVLKRMAALAPGGGGWKDFKTSILMEMGVVFFALLTPGTMTITVVHSLAHVTDGEMACHGMDIAFVGDRRGRRFPAAYTLPKETPWQWKQYKFVDSLVELKSHYEKEDSGRALWKPGRETTAASKKLPKMIQIPMEWVGWLREKPRTGYEMAVEITRRIGLGTQDDPSVTADDAKLWLSWCCAASQEGNKSGDSWLAFEMGAITDESNEWMEWCTMRINSALGEEQTQAPAGSPPAGSTSKTDELLKFLTAHALLGTQVQGTAAAAQTGGMSHPSAHQTNIHMLKGKKYNGNQITKILAWSGGYVTADIQPIWKIYQQTTDLDTIREEVEARMLTWAERQGTGWEVDPAMFLVEQAIEDWRSLRLAPSGATATYANAERGASCLQCCPRTSNEQESERDRERDEADTKSTDTFAARQTRKKSKASDPRDPPDDYGELLKMITTFAGLVWVHFGDKCDLYQCICQIHDILRDKSVQARKEHYTALICRTITWALIEDSRYFFTQTMMPAEFARPGIKNFPKSLLRHDITDIHYAKPLVRPNFPAKWAFDGRMKKERQTHVFSLYGLGGVPSGTGGAAQPETQDPFAALQKEMQAGIRMMKQQLSPSKNETRGTGRGGSDERQRKRKPTEAELAHVHPRLKTFFGGLHDMYGGSCMFSEVLSLSGSTVGDMPTLPNHCPNNRNGLCFNWIGGICPFEDCNLKDGHIPKEEVTDELVNHLERALKPGVDKMLRGERRARGQRKKRRG